MAITETTSGEAVEPPPSIWARFLAAMSSQFSGGNYHEYQRTIDGNFLGAYGINSESWGMWSTAAGLPGASWRDPRAQDVVANWAAQSLYSKFGDWGLVALAWRHGNSAAVNFQSQYGTASSENISKVWSNKEASFITNLAASVGSGTHVPDPGAPPLPGAPVSSGVSLKFIPEEGAPPAPQEVTGAKPAHVALQRVLAAMADRIAGGQRLAVEDLEVNSLADAANMARQTEVTGVVPGASNVKPEDVEHLGG